MVATASTIFMGVAVTTTFGVMKVKTVSLVAPDTILCTEMMVMIVSNEKPDRTVCMVVQATTNWLVVMETTI